MAIIIPSKNIFNINNPKIVDNIIERIEVSSVEIKPNTKLNSIVYNSVLNAVSNNNEATATNQCRVNTLKTNEPFLYAELISYAKITALYCIGTLKIPKNGDNKVITSIDTLGKQDKPKVEVSSTVNLKHGITFANATIVGGEAYEQYNGSTNEYDTNVTIDSSSITRQFSEENVERKLLESHINVSEHKYIDVETIGSGKSFVSTQFDLHLYGNLDEYFTIRVVAENDQVFYYIDFKVMCGAVVDKLHSFNEFNVNPTNTRTIRLQGNSIYYEPNTIEFSVYGSEIGIDIQDKTVYIPSNDTTSKNVYSAVGNELLQITNYYVNKDVNAIQHLFGKTKEEYQKGKETAVVLCSVNNYYNQLGKLYISTNKERIYLTNDNDFVHLTWTRPNNYFIYAYINEPIDFDLYIEIKYTVFLEATETLVIKKGNTVSNYTTQMASMPNEYSIVSIYYDLPMTFNVGDLVVPMIYKSSSIDEPMSLNENNNPKIFEVLGTKLKYDGAIYQELHLQEVGEVPSVDPIQPEQPTQPNIPINPQKPSLPSEDPDEPTEPEASGYYNLYVDTVDNQINLFNMDVSSWYVTENGAFIGVYNEYSIEIDPSAFTLKDFNNNIYGNLTNSISHVIYPFYNAYGTALNYTYTLEIDLHNGNNVRITCSVGYVYINKNKLPCTVTMTIDSNRNGQVTINDADGNLLSRFRDVNYDEGVTISIE